MENTEFKPVRMSDTRVSNRYSKPIGTRFTIEEQNAILTCAYKNGVRKSDVIRGALIYAGVVPTPTSEQKTESDQSPAPTAK